MSAREIYILTKEELEKLFDGQKDNCVGSWNEGDISPIGIRIADYPALPPPVIVPSDVDIRVESLSQLNDYIHQFVFKCGANFILQKLGLKK